MNIEGLLNTYSLYMLIFGVVALVFLAAASLRLKKISPENKKFLFTAIVLVAIIPTLIMAGSTVYINSIAASKGPVHYHADFETWVCGKEVNLKDPEGLTNKIGTPTLHEHNDKRIHVEGVVMTPAEMSLGNFFRVVGGSLSSTSLTIPTNEGKLSVTNGDICEGIGTGQVQVFVYQTGKDGYFAQQKLTDPQYYVLSSSQNVPPGDCIIVEFGASKRRTDKLCRSYKVAEQIGKLKGEHP